MTGSVSAKSSCHSAVLIDGLIWLIDVGRLLAINNPCDKIHRKKSERRHSLKKKKNDDHVQKRKTKNEFMPWTCNTNSEQANPNVQ